MKKFRIRRPRKQRDRYWPPLEAEKHFLSPITDKHWNESWNWFVNSSIPGALSPVLEKLSPPYFLAQLTTSGSSMMLKVLLDKVSADIEFQQFSLLGVTRLLLRFSGTWWIIGTDCQVKKILRTWSYVFEFFRDRRGTGRGLVDWCRHSYSYPAEWE